MKLPFTGEFIRSPDGRLCKVIDVSKVDFTDACRARKTIDITVHRAKGGETVVTYNENGMLEEIYFATPGDAIFIYTNDNRKTYVPADQNGRRWKFGELLNQGYLIVEGCLSSDKVLVNNSRFFKIIHEAVEEDACIKDPFGTGVNQFLHAGATLKLYADGVVRGIEKSMFDKEWEIIPPIGEALRGRFSKKN